MTQLFSPDKPVLVEGVAADGTDAPLVTLSYGVFVEVAHPAGMQVYPPGLYELHLSLSGQTPIVPPVGDYFVSPGSVMPDDRRTHGPRAPNGLNSTSSRGDAVCGRGSVNEMKRLEVRDRGRASNVE